MGVLVALLLLAGLVLAVNGPFGGLGTPADTAPTVGTGGAGPSATPAASSDAAPASAPRAKGGGNGQGRDKDKPDKPGKDKGD